MEPVFPEYFTPITRNTHGYPCQRLPLIADKRSGPWRDFLFTADVPVVVLTMKSVFFCPHLSLTCLHATGKFPCNCMFPRIVLRGRLGLNTINRIARPFSHLLRRGVWWKRVIQFYFFFCTGLCSGSAYVPSPMSLIRQLLLRWPFRLRPTSAVNVSA